MHYLSHKCFRHLTIFVLFLQVYADINLNDLSTCELEQLARQVLKPDIGYELHVSTVEINI